MPEYLYTRTVAADIDRQVIAVGMPGYTLMRRAGAALLACLESHYPDARNVLVLCGAGNNAGDGYAVARLAQQRGRNVTVASLVEPGKLKGVSAQACRDWLLKEEVTGFTPDLLADTDVVIDALLGIGLDRDVEGPWRDCIETVNSSRIPVIAADIPSGLHADNGRVQGIAVRAEHTVSFIARKQGLYTADAKQHCGRIHFADLGVGDEVREQYTPTASLITPADTVLPRRPENSSKGDFGSVLIVGGNTGLAGAVALASRAALRIGAGLVRVVTRPEHVAIVTGLCPEAMVTGSANGELDEDLLQRSSQVLIGCGLGRNAWSQRLLRQVMAADRPVVYDADALNQVAAEGLRIDNAAAITPHPGEAGRLLGCSSAQIQADRYLAVRRLVERFGCTVILKGSGTLVADDDAIHVCAAGSSALASAGMGDVLAGLGVGLLAQGLDATDASCAASYYHALAAEAAAGDRSRGIVASDVIEHLGAVIVEA